MNPSDVCQKQLNLNVQSGITSYDISSLVDDDFEVIGSVMDKVHSLSLGTGSEIPLFDIETGNGSRIIAENTASAADKTTNEDAESIPAANNSWNLMSSDNVGQNVDILSQNTAKSSLASSTIHSIQPFSEDPVKAVVSIRADYQAAQQLARQENELLRKACEKKNEEIEMLRCRLDEEIVHNVHLSAELEETQRILDECRIKVDEAIAGKIEREDIIKVLRTTILQIQSDSNLNCLGSSVLDEQALLSSLNGKKEYIKLLQNQLKQAEERYEKEHIEVLNLEEIVKILHENIQNSQQTHVE